MLLCRVRGLSAAVLDLRSTGSVLAQVTARRLRDVTLTLRKEHTLQGYRCFCVFDSSRVLPGNQQSDLRPLPNRDSPSARGITDWSQLNRITTVAHNLSKSAQSKGANSGLIRQLLVDVKRHPGIKGEPGGYVCSWGVSSGIMQTRSSSTKKSDTASEKTDDGNKEEGQNLNQATAASSSTSQAPGEPEPAEGKPSKTQQLKKVFKEYGAVGVSFHICISLMSLGMFYLLISSGIDMAALLCKLGFSEAMVQSRMAAGTSTFVLAYAIHKLFAPVRISITLVSVPLIVRYLRKTGLFRPPTPGH